MISISIWSSVREASNSDTDTDGDTDADKDADADTSGTPTGGCGKTPPSTPPGEVDVAGVTRTFITDVPASYDPEVPTPVLFAFHGYGINGTFFRNWADLLSTFGASYIVLHPDALGDPSAWDNQDGRDVAFFDTLLEFISSTYCVDSERVFVTGHSYGGMFTNTLGCTRGDVIRGIAPMSGTGPNRFDTCHGPLAVIVFHGIDDTTVALSSGEASRDYWGAAADCDMAASSPYPANDVCVDYHGCDDGYPLVFCPYDGDHNLWNAAPQVMFDFFEAI